jgi:hypothetical protein
MNSPAFWQDCIPPVQQILVVPIALQLCPSAVTVGLPAGLFPLPSKLPPPTPPPPPPLLTLPEPMIPPPPSAAFDQPAGLPQAHAGTTNDRIVRPVIRSVRTLFMEFK